MFSDVTGVIESHGYSNQLINGYMNGYVSGSPRVLS